MGGVGSAPVRSRARDPATLRKIAAQSKLATYARLNLEGCSAMGCQRATRVARNCPDRIGALNPRAVAGSKRSSRCSIRGTNDRYFGWDAAWNVNGSNGGRRICHRVTEKKTRREFKVEECVRTRYISAVRAVTMLRGEFAEW